METMPKTGTEGTLWGGGRRPMEARYGKMMLWFFLASDSLTFTGFVLGYGLARFKFLDIWPIADEVFAAFPFFSGNAPLFFPAFMTFLLIFSSVTMVLAVTAGHYNDRKKVTLYMALTLFGGLTFLGSQAWEWAHFIKGSHGAIETSGGKIVHVFNTDGKQVALKDFAQAEEMERVPLTGDKAGWFKTEDPQPVMTFDEVKAGFLANENLRIRLPNIDKNKDKIMLSRSDSEKLLESEAQGIVEGANLKHNEYGHPLFADFFFFVTGFHGFHVTIGITLLIITFINVLLGTYEKRGHYRMVEKVGLYWHFVDLVWVFVFTFFYLV